MTQVTEIPPEKKETVQELAAVIRASDVIAVAGFRGIPAPQLQTMRANLREHARLKVAKNNLIRLAMEEVADDRDGLEDLEEHVHGQTMLIGSDADSFQLFRHLEGTKSKAPAKGGETAEEDVEVTSGETPFQPGPIVGELQQAGIPAAIEGGKVVIQTDRVVVEQGEEIPRETAQMLTRLDIHPVTVGLEFRAALEDGTVFQRDVLDVDLDAFQRDLETAIGQGFNLAVEIAYVTPETAPALLAKARTGAASLAREAGIVTRDTAPDILRTAHGQAHALASRLSPQARGDDGSDAGEEE